MTDWRTLTVPASEFDLVSQFSHYFAGSFFVAIPALIFGAHIGLYIGALYALYAAIKEFYYDRNFETPAVRGSSLKDFLVQLGGVLFASAVLLIFHGAARP